MQGDLFDRIAMDDPVEGLDFLTSILESSTEYSIVSTDLDGTIVLWNEGARQIYGYEPGELVGSVNAAFLSTPDDLAQGKPRQMFEMVLRDGRWDGALEQTRKSGERFKARVVVTPRRGVAGQILGYLFISKDISGWAHITDEREAVQAYTRSLIESNIDLLTTTDPSGLITDVNRQMCEITGRERDDLIGIPFKDCFTDPERAEAGIRLVLTEGRATNYELTIRGKAGEDTVVSYNATTFRDVAGRTQGVIASARNVTEQKRLEDQLRQAQKMEAIGQLAGGIAHDFNNLLTVIIGFSEMLIDDTDPTEEQREVIGQIMQAGTVAATLTRQLLAFSRRLVVAPQDLDLNVTVEQFSRILRRLVGEDITLSLVLAPNLGTIRADPGQIEQVLMNLVTNARDAMPSGGRLTIETANVDLDVSSASGHPSVRLGPQVLLSVTDSGVGMDAALRARIFEPFFTTKELGKGHGLGLAAVHGIVQQNGGSIDVQSSVGVGTTFTMYFPRSVPRADRVEAVVGLAHDPSGSETILIAEDDARLRALTRGALEEGGYTVIEAGDGEAALAVAAKHSGPIHLLLTDVVMPNLGGRLLAERLLALHPSLKVIYVSGYTDDMVLRHGVVNASVEFLQKPFSLHGLSRKVRQVLDAT